ncbi:hypothetical protein GCM10010483_32990 [Actinokineospora diospyrosa]
MDFVVRPLNGPTCHRGRLLGVSRSPAETCPEPIGVTYAVRADSRRLRLTQLRAIYVKELRVNPS